ncbi:CGNR zinc finger domain-containing protein [Actinoplanes sp. NPDC051470]|uniref:CGNR zinc finger domain-containing protein n=1 Tax=Actinoplanes sp. NPDC051470 TaxID=3157224 RepID=UPI00343CA243
MDLRIVGGHPALDLANTVAPRQTGDDQIEFLSDPAALLAWAPRIGIVTGADIERVERSWSPEAALADVLELRSLVDLTLAGQDLDRLSRRWAAAMDRSALAPTSPVSLLVGTDPAWMIGDRLADALVDLLRTADLSRLRACPPDEGGCGFLFLDRSRNLTRRWCSMDDCGAQAKSRRLTERRRVRGGRSG